MEGVVQLGHRMWWNDVINQIPALTEIPIPKASFCHSSNQSFSRSPLCSPYSIDRTLNKTVPSHAKSEKTETWSDSWDKHRWTCWTCRLGSESGIGHLGDKNCRLERQVDKFEVVEVRFCRKLIVLAHFLSWTSQHGPYIPQNNYIQYLKPCQTWTSNRLNYHVYIIYTWPTNPPCLPKSWAFGVH